MKSKLADALASGDAAAVTDLATRISASAAVQGSEADEEQPALPYRQVAAER